MLGKLFGGQPARRPCPICGHEVEASAVRCDGCGRTIAMPETLRSVKREQVKLQPVRPREPREEE